MSKSSDILNKILFWGIVISGLVYTFWSKNYIFIPSVYIPAVFVSLIIKPFFKYKKIPPFYELPVNICLWTGLIGEYYFYYHTVYYDKFLHFFIPMLLASIVYEYFLINSKGFPRKDLVFLAVLGLSAGFEIFEYFQAIWFNFPSVGVYIAGTTVMPPYEDTIWDMACVCFGCLTYLVFKTIKEKSKRADKHEFFVKKR